MHQHPLRIARRAQLLAPVAERPDELLLLGVDADHGLAQGQLQLDRLADVPELRVAVGVAGAFERLAVGLQAVAHVVEQLRHGLVADPVATPSELGREVADAPGRPAQGGLGIAPRGGLDERLQVRAQGRVALLDGRSPGARPPDPAAVQALAGADIGHPTRHRRAREAGRPCDGRHPTPSDGERLGSRRQAPGPFVEQRGHRLVPGCDGRLIDHPCIIPQC